MCMSVCTHTFPHRGNRQKQRKIIHVIDAEFSKQKQPFLWISGVSKELFLKCTFDQVSFPSLNFSVALFCIRRI